MPANAENEQHSENEDFGAIDVTAFMEQVRLEVPRDTVMVQGTVGALRRPPNSTEFYGELRGFDQSVLSFQCSAATRLRKDDHVVLRGTLRADRSKFRSGFDLVLLAIRVGKWTPDEPFSNNQTTNDQTTLNRSHAKVSLERFLAKHPLKQLVLIGTKTAVGDAQAVLIRGFGQPLDQRITTTGLASLQAQITEAAPNFDGICLLRGGGDPNSFSTWNDSRLIETLLRCGKPFYTALGHWTDLTLADMYADESFAAPSALGAACVEGWKARTEREQLERRCEYLRLDNRKLKAAGETAKGVGLDTKIAAFQAGLDALGQLPATLGKQTDQSVGMAARDAMKKLTRELRIHIVLWVVSVFLLGILTGAFGYRLLGSSGVNPAQEQPGTSQGQAPAAVHAPGAKATRRQIQ